MYEDTTTSKVLSSIIIIIIIIEMAGRQAYDVRVSKMLAILTYIFYEMIIAHLLLNDGDDIRYCLVTLLITHTFT